MIQKILKKFFSIDTILCSALVFLVMYLASWIAPKIEALNPFDLALNDFEMLDLGFNKELWDPKDIDSLKNKGIVDTNIVLVNIGNYPRKNIAEMLSIINAQKPIVVGIDAGFIPDKDPYGDSLLESALAGTKNLVLYTMLSHTDEEKDGGFEAIEYCNPRFARHGTPGFVNMVVPEDGEFHTCREFKPQEFVGNKRFLPISLQAAWFADSNKVKKFLDRQKNIEVINYRGNFTSFSWIDGSQLLSKESETGFMGVEELNVAPDFFTNKIVFMGFMGPMLDPTTFKTTTVEDKFFTPLNKNVAGKSHPDMFGVVVHANIASMVLNGKPIDVMSNLGCLIIALILCYLNVMGFFYIHRNHQTWYDLSVKIIQIFEVLIILGVSIWIFAEYQYKVNLTIAAFAVGLSGDVLEVYVGLKEKLRKPGLWLIGKATGFARKNEQL